MPVQFMTDPLIPKDKQKMAGIINEVSQKPQSRNWEQNAVFLRNFTLALMGQHYQKRHSEVLEKEIEKLNQSFGQSQKPRPQIISPPIPLRSLNLPEPPTPYYAVSAIEKKPVVEDLFTPPMPPEEMTSQPEKQREIQFTGGVYEKTFSPALTQNNQVSPGDVLPEQILDVPKPD